VWRPVTRGPRFGGEGNGRRFHFIPRVRPRLKDRFPGASLQSVRRVTGPV